MQHADRIYINGKIYTQSERGMVGAMALNGDKILYVGDDTASALSLASTSCCVTDLAGRTILPGFIDSHTHPSCVSLTKWRVILPHTYDLTELLESAAAYCAAHPKEEVPFFNGECYYLSMFDEEGPKKELLDEYISDRPARIQDFTDHSCWYNSMALEMMGITKDVSDSDLFGDSPGEIIRYPDGEPTGWVMEVPGNDLEIPMYEKLGWFPPMEATEDMVTPFLSFMNKSGVTALFDAFTCPENDMRMYYEMDQKGALHMYYEGSVLLTSSEPEDIAEAVQTARAWQEKYTSKHVHVNTIKVFLDGTNELGDSGSLEPLRTDPSGEDYGMTYFTMEQLTDIIAALNEEGLDVHFHIVGDRTFRSACDAVEAARKICGGELKIRVTCAHCELVHPDDRHRPGELGININWSPHWSGGYFGDAAIQYLGKERFDTMYDFREMLSDGVNIAYSSDVFSYKEANRAAPFFGISVGMTRIDPEIPLDPEKYPGSIRQPEGARMSLDELIYGYTMRGARQLGLEKEMGSLEKGKLANYIILPKDPHELNPDEIRTLVPDEVWLEGERIC